MKNDIKKYLTLGAVLAGSAFMVSCDGDDVQVSEISAQSLADAIAAADSTSLSKVVSNDATFNAAVTNVNKLNLTFSTGSGTTIIDATTLNSATTGWVTTGTEAIESGDTLDLGTATAAITYSGVTSVGGVITVTTLDVIDATEDDFSDLILTESASTTVGGDTITTGTFTLNAVTLASGGIDVPQTNSDLDTAEGVDDKSASNPTSFPLGDDNATAPGDAALESVSGKQPTVTISGDVFTVAVGDTLFINGGVLYVTDTTSPATVIPGSPTLNDLTVATDVAAGGIIKLRSGSVLSETVALTGEYVSTIK